MIFAINGRNGNTIWEFREVEVETNSPIVIDLYTINTVRDLDGDEVPEILAVHVEEREESKAGHIKLISGKTGRVIRTIPTPFKEEVFVPLQVVTKEDGTEVLLIITGGQNTPGGVYSIRLLSLMQFTSEKGFTPLHQTGTSGFMVPSIITDINGDNVDDFVVSSFNSTVYAFDGRNFSMLWNFTFPTSESISAIVPGHFNHDNVTDFMIKYNTGPGFPVYYYSQTTVLDGLTGAPLLDAMITDSGGASSLLGGVSISQTFGGDFFLHWQTQCRGKYDAKDAFEFIPDSDIISQARADTCRLRYNTTNVVKLYAIARHIEPPGAVIFSTDDIEVQVTPMEKSISKEHSPKSPFKHPKMLKKLMRGRDSGSTTEVESTTKTSMKKTPHRPKKTHHAKGNTSNHRLFVERLEETNSEPENLANEQAERQFYPHDINQQQFRNFKDYEAEPGRYPQDYDDILYNDNEVAPQSAVQNDRPIRLRTKYPGDRDVRSDIESTKAANETHKEGIKNTGSVSDLRQNHSPEEQKPLSLWDLELEKEQSDAIKEAHKFDYSTKLRERRRRQDKSQNKIEISDSTSDPLNNTTDDWYLASISSTGVLLKSLTNTRSSLDFVFILNLRESETFPPLLLPEDLNCMEEKISAYKTFTNDNLRLLQKQFLKKCLNARIGGNINPPLAKYESQLVITRIGITCTCRSLQPGEVCSELEEIQKQRWTEFMGHDGHGVYRN